MATPARMPLSRSSSDNRLASTFAMANAKGANISINSVLQSTKRAFFPSSTNSSNGDGNNSTGDYASSSSPSTSGNIYYATRLGATGELAISGGTMAAYAAELNGQVDSGNASQHNTCKFDLITLPTPPHPPCPTPS